MNFAHLHVHTDNSLLDGKGKIEEYVQRAVALEMPALAITDHGNVCGAPEFYMACRDAGIRPILGQEFYFVPDAEAYKEMKGERFHVGILARSEFGFKVLCELSTEAHRRFHYKPVIDRKVLTALSKKERASLVVMSGCAASIISRKILGEEKGSADEEILWWKKMFPHFHVELMQHGTSFDRKLNKGLIRLAKKHRIPWVITNDPHYVHRHEAPHHDAILAIQTGSDIDDPNRFRFEGKGYWLKSPKEMKKAFRDYEKGVWKPGMKRTLTIAEDCDIRIPSWESRSWHIPAYPDVKDAQKRLKRLAWEGLKARGLDGDKRYVKRMKKELKEFKTVRTENGTGMADFLLITLDAINTAKKTIDPDTGRPIPVGPGRGSVCSTLVGYLIGIHKVDPIRYDLLFERFFNPERPKMPDVDTDYGTNGRQLVLDYYPEKYGEENTGAVAAFGTMQAKRAFQSMARAYGIDFDARMKLSNKIKEDEEGNVVWPEEVMREYPDLIRTIDSLLGLKGSLSSHPAGVVIFDPKDPIKELVPLMWIPKRADKPGRFVMQYNLAAVDALGLLKQDNLGLRTLDTIDECVRMVEERHGVVLDPDSWVPDEEEHDDAIYAMLAEGRVNGIFQMEGGANQRGIQEINPTCFEDIATCTSLYRAGPIVAGAPARFLKNKRDGKVRVIHDSLRPHLARSWGELIYQEQMFAILNEVAGLSWARVDDVKTATSKKDAKKMAECKADAVEGFQKVGGMSEREAEATWNMIASQSLYLFNRSHAIAYSILTYQTARLKYLYPLEFFAALLRTVEGKSQADKAKRENYLMEAVASGFRIMPPDVNLSDGKFVPHGKDELLFGLTDIKGVGPAVMAKIATWKKERGQKRPFKSPDEVAECLGTKDRTKGAFNTLCNAGALRSLKVSAVESEQEKLLGFQFADYMAEYREKYAEKVKRPKGNNSKCLLYGQIVKIEKRKTKKGGTFYVWVIRWAPGEEYQINVWEDASSLFRLQKGSIVRVRGNWQASWKNLSVSDSDQVKVLKEVLADKKEKAA